MINQQILIKYVVLSLVGAASFCLIAIYSSNWLVNTEFMKFDLEALQKSGESAESIHANFLVKEFIMYFSVFLMAAMPISLILACLEKREALVISSIAAVIAIAFLQSSGFFRLLVVGQYPWLYGVFIFFGMLIIVHLLNKPMRTLTRRFT